MPAHRPPLASGAQKISSDSELSSQLAVSAEVKASVLGVRVGAAASYAASSMSNSQSVYIVAQVVGASPAPVSCAPLAV